MLGMIVLTVDIKIGFQKREFYGLELLEMINIKDRAWTGKWRINKTRIGREWMREVARQWGKIACADRETGLKKQVKKPHRMRSYGYASSHFAHVCFCIPVFEYGFDSYLCVSDLDLINWSCNILCCWP